MFSNSFYLLILIYLYFMCYIHGLALHSHAFQNHIEVHLFSSFHFPQWYHKPWCASAVVFQAEFYTTKFFSLLHFTKLFSSQWLVIQCPIPALSTVTLTTGSWLAWNRAIPMSLDWKPNLKCQRQEKEDSVWEVFYYIIFLRFEYLMTRIDVSNITWVNKDYSIKAVNNLNASK